MFMLVANRQTILQAQLHFNDSIVAFCMILAIYYLFYNCPMGASLFLSIALSIKAMALILVVPVFTWMAQVYGTRVTGTGVGIVICYQVMIALPFIFKSAAKVLFISDGGKTSVVNYLV